MACTSKTKQELINRLTDKKLIKQSLIFPHQIDIAMEIMLSIDNIHIPTDILRALNDAYELAIPNLVELFPVGDTAVVIDTSGSMYGSWSGACKIGKNSIN